MSKSKVRSTTPTVSVRIGRELADKIKAIVKLSRLKSSKSIGRSESYNDYIINRLGPIVDKDIKKLISENI